MDTQPGTIWGREPAMVLALVQAVIALVVAFGLNLSFSNGLGYPGTRWLILDGAWHEQDFKRYLFHHQIPTQSWYKAFPGLSNYDMARNSRIRDGLTKNLSGEALRRWIAEI